MRNPETLEQAREMLLEDDNLIQELTQTRDTLTGQMAERDAQIEELRTLNQKLFLRVSQGTEPEEKDEPEESLEDFASQLKGVIRR